MKKERAKLLWIMVVLVVTLAVLQFCGVVFYFYNKFWWLDTLNHFIGGLFVGLFAIWLFYYSGYVRGWKGAETIRAFVLTAVVSTFVVAVCWEIYEYLLGPFYTYSNYPLDTTKDITIGVVGSFVSAFIFSKNKV